MDNIFRSPVGIEGNYKKELYKKDSETTLSDGIFFILYIAVDLMIIESHGEIYEFGKDNLIMKIGVKYRNKKTLK